MNFKRITKTIDGYIKHNSTNLIDAFICFVASNNKELKNDLEHYAFSTGIINHCGARYDRESYYNFLDIKYN